MSQPALVMIAVRMYQRIVAAVQPCMGALARPDAEILPMQGVRWRAGRAADAMGGACGTLQYSVGSCSTIRAGGVGCSSWVDVPFRDKTHLTHQGGAFRVK